jgi:hypothetical protein
MKFTSIFTFRGDRVSSETIQKDLDGGDCVLVESDGRKILFLCDIVAHDTEAVHTYDGWTVFMHDGFKTVIPEREDGTLDEDHTIWVNEVIYPESRNDIARKLNELYERYVESRPF